MRDLRAGPWRSGSAGEIGHALAVLAVLCQLLGVFLLPISAAAMTDTALSLAGVICHAGGETGRGPSKAPHRHGASCAFCPLCRAISLPLLSPTPPSLPTPSWAAAMVERLPPRASPAVGVLRPSVQARAPPPAA